MYIEHRNVRSLGTKQATAVDKEVSWYKEIQQKKINGSI